MSAENFDKHFRDRLYKHESAVEGAAVWKGVEAGLSGRRKPAFFWWAAGALIVLLTAGGAAYFGLSPKTEVPAVAEAAEGETEAESSNQNTSNAQPDDTETSPPQATDNIGARGSEGFNPTSENASDAQEEPTAQQPAPTAVDPAPQAVAPAVDREADRSFAGGESNPSENSRARRDGGEFRTSGRTPFSGKEKSESPADTSPTTAIGNDRGAAKPGPEGHADRSVSTLPIAGRSYAGSDADGTAGDTPQSATRPTAAIAAFSDGGASPPGLGEASVKNAVMLLPQLPAAQLPLHAESPLLKGEKLPSPAESYPYGAHRKFFVQLDAGGGMLRREIISHHDDYRDLTRSRNNTERPLEYLSADLTLGMRYENGLFWRSGVSITQFNEHFNLDRTRTQTEETEVLSNVHVNANGDSVYTYTQTTETTIFTEQISHYNSYTLVDIPLFAGYERHFGAWSFGAEAGIFLNVLMDARGAMLGPTDEVIRMEDSGMFRERVQWNAAVNVRISRQVSERFQAVLSPGIRILPESVMAISEMEQRYVLIGGTFGVVYAF